MSDKNKKSSSDKMGKLKNVDVNKKTSSLVLNYSPEQIKEEQEKQGKEKNTSGLTEDTEDSYTSELDEPGSTKRKKKKKKKVLIENAEELKEKELNELKKQVEVLGKIKKLLNTEVSTLIAMGIKLIKKVNGKIFGNKKPKKEEKVIENIDSEENTIEKEEKFSVQSLIDLNIIFTDNKKKPLYLSKKETAYAQNDEILNIATITKIQDVFKDTAKRLKKVPVPDKGIYKDVPLTEIMTTITEEEIMQFLIYVKKFPSKYIGKNYRISESFAAWVMSGTPDN